MGFSLFALAIFIFFTLDSDYASSPVYAASEGVQFCGFLIVLLYEFLFLLGDPKKCNVKWLIRLSSVIMGWLSSLEVRYW
ncbi:hypothetical protein Acr_19g0008680 [Actinidia rufa]|uniref:Uncharacterized protein n=1 Tax=Actinidia rufa TaxID=165716 RepID=A0A7J0GAZ7_9ERIC|nr:hypothetical protein Acr_19g0008680 [Actinidia rufa]